MTEQQIRRELRLLKGYALVTTVVLFVLSLSAFRRGERREKFTEIDVERINVVEPDGKYRMVISNRPRSIGPIYKGQPFGYAGGGRPGIIFFNDEGTENGGLTFAGKDSAGKIRASTHMSFDQFNQDQVLNLDYNDNDGQRLVGISMLDRAQVDIHDMIAERDSIRKIADSSARAAAMARWAAPRNGVPLIAQRVFLGRNATKAALLTLADQNGKTRIRLAVDSTGTPALEFLDDAGRVTSRLPEIRK
jgi:hypothetical protein